jgi:hypothetical protein
MNNNNHGGFLFILVIILSIWIYNLRSDINDWKSRSKGLDAEIYSLKWDIMELEATVDSLNSQIETAKNYTWSSYDDMGYALDELHTE